MARNPFRRKVRVVTQTTTRKVHVYPNSADYAKVEDVVRGLARQYVAISREIEPLFGKPYGREFLYASLGRMDQITRTIAGLTGTDPIYVSVNLDDHEKAYDTHGNLIDLELDDHFDSARIALERMVPKGC